MNANATTLDVSRLPSSAEDHRSPIWWGNVLFLLIETTTLGIMVASYLYFRVVDFQQWPPPRVNHMPILYKPLPDLPIGTVNLALILLGCLPMAWVDRSCLKMKARPVKIGLMIGIVIGLVSAILRYFEFSAIHFKWNDNAYASVVWTILGLHMSYIVTATVESILMLAWIFLHPLDVKHARDIRTTAIYWYWVAGTWLLLYLLIYWVPHWF